MIASIFDNINKIFSLSIVLSIVLHVKRGEPENKYLLTRSTFKIYSQRYVEFKTVCLQMNTTSQDMKDYDIVKTWYSITINCHGMFLHTGAKVIFENNMEKIKHLL